MALRFGSLSHYIHLSDAISITENRDGKQWKGERNCEQIIFLEKGPAPPSAEPFLFLLFGKQHQNLIASCYEFSHFLRL